MTVEIGQSYQAVGVANNRNICAFLAGRSGKERADELIVPISVGGAAGGVCIGAVGGGVGGPPGAAGGAALGCGVGVLSGTAKSVVNHYKAYKEWIKKQDAYKESEVFRELSDHDTLQKYLCPISYQFYTKPVRSPHGHVYDFASISDPLLRDDFGMIQDPYRNGAFRVEDLTEVPELLIEMKTAMVNVLNDEIENGELSEEVMTGLRAFIEGLNQDIEERRRFIEDQLIHQVASQNVSKNACQIM